MDSDDRQAWSPALAFWNTAGTVAGAVSGWAAILILLYLEVLR